MAVLNPRVRHVAIDGGLFQAEVEARQIMAVPKTELGGADFASGRIELKGNPLAKIDTGAAAREARQADREGAREVLIIGGGPAGAAAVYAAPQRASALASWPSALVARPWTPSASRTSFRCWRPKAPKFAARLGPCAPLRRRCDHAAARGQDRAAGSPGGCATVTLENGATSGRTVILAPARAGAT